MNETNKQKDFALKLFYIMIILICLIGIFFNESGLGYYILFVFDKLFTTTMAKIFLGHFIFWMLLNIFIKKSYKYKKNLVVILSFIGYFGLLLLLSSFIYTTPVKPYYVGIQVIYLLNKIFESFGIIVAVVLTSAYLAALIYTIVFIVKKAIAKKRSKKAIESLNDSELPTYDFGEKSKEIKEFSDKDEEKNDNNNENRNLKESSDRVVFDPLFINNMDFEEEKNIEKEENIETKIENNESNKQVENEFDIFSDDIFSDDDIKIEEAKKSTSQEFDIFNDSLFDEEKEEENVNTNLNVYDDNVVEHKAAPSLEDIVGEEEIENNNESIQEINEEENFEDVAEEEETFKEEPKKEETMTSYKPELDTNLEFDNANESKKEVKAIKYNYKLPPLSLLNNAQYNDNTDNNTQADIKAIQLNAKLKSLGINGKVVNCKVAPAFTRFEIQVENDVKINQIPNAKNDIMMALSAEKINILAPIPGTNYVGVDIPNVHKSLVTFKECLIGIPYEERENKLIIPLGKDITDKVVYISLDNAPHLLVGGVTGTGKSVCLNTIISTLCMRTYPNEVGLMLIDPKRVEFSPFKPIPNLICPVITDAKKAVVALKKLCEEMDKRYTILSEAGFRNIKGYNKNAEETGKEKMKYIVCVIDEFADLITLDKSAEDYVRRITSLARSAGIVLIVATQRPSVDIITGVVKTNIPSRIAFTVASNQDSRVILDEGGAEELLGKGDMLLKFSGFFSTQRIQGCYIDEDEIEKICDYLKNSAEPNYMEEFLDLEEKSPEQIRFEEIASTDKAGDDELYDEIVNFLHTTSIVSVSLLRKKFILGQPRAARMIDRLEEDGYISPQTGINKPRNVYKHKLPSLDDDELIDVEDEI